MQKEFALDKRVLVDVSDLSGGLVALLDAFNLADAAALGALLSVQRLQLFRRWVLTAGSPEALENIVLPAVVTRTGENLGVVCTPMAQNRSQHARRMPGLSQHLPETI